MATAIIQNKREFLSWEQRKQCSVTPIILWADFLHFHTDTMIFDLSDHPSTIFFYCCGDVLIYITWWNWLWFSQKTHSGMERSESPRQFIRVGQRARWRATFCLRTFQVKLTSIKQAPSSIVCTVSHWTSILYRCATVFFVEGYLEQNYILNYSLLQTLTKTKHWWPFSKCMC